MDAGDQDVNIDAGGDVELLEAVDESHSDEQGFDLAVQGSKKEKSADLGVTAGANDERQGGATQISADNVNINADKVVDQETDIDANSTNISGEVEQRDVTDEQSGFKVAVDASAAKNKGRDALGRRRNRSNSNSSGNSNTSSTSTASNTSGTTTSSGGSTTGTNGGGNSGNNGGSSGSGSSGGSGGSGAPVVLVAPAVPAVPVALVALVALVAPAVPAVPVALVATAPAATTTPATPITATTTAAG
ncbi:hypothetical protein ASALC70_03640 [Alcanivorax sp. ALC70]|nr:hypothetical protein ASALC70_03640 [Alcanivorax sp. ALC70]